jgi:NDP-sugar pyrophosphorylase family protein
MKISLPDVSAAVLAGGRGTRLRSVVGDVPKVIASVGGKPFLTFILEQLAWSGVRNVVLLTGYAADQVELAIGSEFAGICLTYSVESSTLGTAGSVRQALAALQGDTILLLNGDSYCEVDLHAFLRFHISRQAGVSLALARVADTSRFGRVQCGPDGRLLRFEEKAASEGTGWINAGVYLLRRTLLQNLTIGSNASLENDLLPGWVDAGLVYGFRGGRRFIDIGIPETFGQAEAFFQQRTPRIEPHLASGLIR